MAGLKDCVVETGLHEVFFDIAFAIMIQEFTELSIENATINEVLKRSVPFC